LGIKTTNNEQAIAYRAKKVKKERKDKRGGSPKGSKAKDHDQPVLN
jgi:hypothetical protein